MPTFLGALFICFVIVVIVMVVGRFVAEGLVCFFEWLDKQR